MANQKKYFKAEPEVFLEYNLGDKRSRTLVRPEVKDTLEQYKQRLEELPIIDDKYLIEQAKQHSFLDDTVRERDILVAMITEMEEQLVEMEKADKETPPADVKPEESKP